MKYKKAAENKKKSHHVFPLISLFLVGVHTPTLLLIFMEKLHSHVHQIKNCVSLMIDKFLSQYNIVYD